MKWLLVFLFLIPFVSGVSFSPTSLEFNLEEGELGCKDVKLEVGSVVDVRDVWARNFMDEWSVTRFDLGASDLGIDVSYPSKVFRSVEEIEACVSAEREGSYKGALIFREEPNGGSVVQFVVWIELHVSGGDDEDESEVEEDKGSKGESSKKKGSSSSSGVVWTNEKLSYDNEEIGRSDFRDFGVKNEKIELSGRSSVKENEIGNYVLFAGLTFLLVIVFVALILFR